MVLLLDRKGKLPANEKVRQIGKQRQIGSPVQEVKREEEIRRHAIAMRLDVDRNVKVFRKPHPPVQQRQAILDPPKTDIGLQIDMAHGKLRGQLQRQAKIVDRTRKTNAFDLQTGALNGLAQENDIVAIGIVSADAIEASLHDHRGIFSKTAFKSVRMPALHCP